MIQTLKEMIIRFCAYGIEIKGSDGFIHYWCTFIPALKLAYMNSIQSSTGNTPAMLKKVGIQTFWLMILKKDLADSHPASSTVELLPNKVRHHASQRMNYDFSNLEL
ncbi:hypothetical protein O181_116384 [Austropuccinia psidii MF-1]|uniref:Uncharacterized protein n=1 Tax=Austropuccinia psidii MF-1 TaxID=1389203 RepID=A0A9Q3KBD1_9BASI|nr:hypothetical protein [Austropuccinia psidii MF-1]